ncbi:ABC transporter permease [Virgibacillus flavescens]|uniref:ABC transporter permease n=1 Tax=Virgibacillus flavescens TaxID=1611422 RepID=UPI003D338C4E
MNSFRVVLYAEVLKIRKSKILWFTLAAFSIAPLMGGFFMFVLKNPELAESAGLLGAKAQIVGEANWPSYLSLLAQTIAVGGILTFGFITSWVFGREYTDRTAKDLLALPYSRAIIVNAKFVTILLTNILLSLHVIIVGIIIGLVIGLPMWTLSVVIHGLYVLMITTLLTVALGTPVAFFAIYGRGYLGPLGFVVLMVVFSQIIAAAGYGAYFPWAVPALYSGVTGTAQILPISSVSIVLLVSLLGFISTHLLWLFADQH